MINGKALSCNLLLFTILQDVKKKHAPLEKSRARSSSCCGLALLWVDTLNRDTVTSGILPFHSVELKWVKLMWENEFLLLLLYTIHFFHRRARVTFDTSETQKVFGPIVIDYHQVCHFCLNIVQSSAEAKVTSFAWILSYSNQRAKSNAFSLF